MILTNDTMSEPNDKNTPPELIRKGQRTLAKEFFEDKDVKLRVQTWLMNTTVLIKSGGNKGSGVILLVDSTKVYVLTAKHVLYTLSGVLSPGAKKPADFNNKNFLNTLQIDYAPAGLLKAPAKTAAVTGLEFTGTDDQTWLYDIVILESTDNDFRSFAEQLAFVPQDEEKYKALLSVKNKGCDALDAKAYEFFQLGYGDGRDKAYQATQGKGYTDYGGKLQCKISVPSNKIPIDNAFEPDSTVAAAKWQRSNQICMMNADVTNSSGPGDSGGPLFCRLITDKNQFYLVGVTSGANFFSDSKLLEQNAKLPADNVVHNNAVTYFKNLFDAWKWD